MGERDSPQAGLGAVMLTGTSAILETAEQQLTDEFGPDTAWVDEVRHHIGKALDVIRANTEPVPDRLD